MVINTNIKNDKRYDFKKLAQLIVEDYFNIKDIILNIQYNDIVCDHFSTDDVKINAILDKQKTPKMYNLIIREYTPLKNVICHEMVHLAQYERGDMKLYQFEDKMVFEWKGKQYDPDTPYEDRPWELEAQSLQNKLWKKYKQECVF